ncbi:MAG: chloride channel protein [Clostridiales bacterium]|jgi:H+/Cl- antiporter ClcA|nr:chloride channel protein [Clostridiales bacterium]
MKNKLKSFSLFISAIIKWLIIAGGTGGAVGAVSAGFMWLLEKATEFTGGIDRYFLMLPAAMFLSAFLVKYLAPSAEGHGTEKAIEAIHNNGGRIKIGVIPVKIAATVITIAGGGSAGKEGPTTQIGAGAASFIARVLRLDVRDTKALVVCGMSAAFAAIFATPIAAAVFTVEVLVVGRLNLRNIFPVMTAAIAGYFVSNALGVTPDAMPNLSSFAFTPSNALFNIGIALLAGLFFGIVSLITVSVINGTHKLSSGLRIYKPLKGLIGGGVIVVLALIFGTDYLGMGINYFTKIAEGQEARLYDFLLKIIFTAITLSFGGSGGVLTPLMFIGITSGSAFASVFNLDPSVFACLGMLAVLASSTNTPLACIIMAFEMFFSPSFAVIAAVACPVAYLVTGHRSVYPTQLMRESKIESIRLESITAEQPKEVFFKRKR